MVNETIKKKRQDLGLTQKEFADALNMGKNGDRTLRRWENGETKPSSLEVDKLLEFANTIPFSNPKNSKFSFIDLFAGIGGIKIPFTELKGKCVFSSEWDKFAQKTYRVNHGEEPQGDITQIDPNTIPDHDLLLAGFPCQPFSQAGKKQGFSDTRGTMFFYIEEILKRKRPKAYLLENVKQLKGHDKGNTLKTIVKHLEQLNYSVDFKVLRAADFGIPQNRERIYIVGFDKTQLSTEKITSFKFPIPPKIQTRLGDILEKNVDEKYTISDTLYQGHLRRKEQHKSKGNGFGFSLYNEDSVYTNTISARYYKDGSEILIEQKGKNPRKLTPRECARLQGFPEEFIIPVSDTQAYRQFGNSVAVPVIRAIALSMMPLVLENTL
ncbi:MAG: DNA (cytosine-5-)-methyltransferase [Brevinema sp.]